ncbi:MAG TPA: glycosyltransferase family 2 protein [Candidatus Acidoferrum sp.]|nr:glycosyltransferase family 2 protein [Candidatus Acidoferrum sp.]
MSGTHFQTYVFWCATFLLLYTYAGYPLWIYLRSRLHPRPQQQRSILPTVSIILAVHNGASLLRQKVAHLLSLDYPQGRMEIEIVSDGSTDGTDDILKEFRNPQVRCLRSAEHLGKAAALNLGMQSATGEILLFLDIRPWIESGALQLLISNFADPQVGCVTGELVLREDGHDAGAKAIGGLYWRYEQWIRNCEAKVDSPLGVYGGFYAIRRKLASALPEGTILDDMLQPLSVIRQGYRSVLDLRARVYDIWPKSLRGEFHRKVRTLAGNFQLLQLAPWLLSRQNRLRFELISHKLMRLFVPILLVLLLVTSTLLSDRSLLYAGALVAQIVFYALAILGVGRGIPFLTRIAGPASAFCMLNAAVVVGFYKFLFTRGPLWKIWTSGASASLTTDGRPSGELNARMLNLSLQDQLRTRRVTR